jgi:hypothetical protein
LYKTCLNKKWHVGLKEYMLIDVNNITWAWSPRVGWIGEKIIINEKGLTTINAQK